MAKFVIECPNCGRYAQARSGFFARKKIQCSCGYTINVKTEKMSSRVCPHCGNVVVFDQSKGAKAKCPVCHEPINTLAEQTQLVEITCEQCGVHLQVSKAATTYTCPVCDHENNVAERLAKENIKKEGLASVIKYEGDNETLVWKHPIEDFNYGSQLIVHESQEAIFFRDGQALDLFGPGRYTLETQQLPMLEKIYKPLTGSQNVFHSEVYFINMTTQMGVKWGTDSKVRLFDPGSGMHVELGASGEFSIRVTNSRKFLVKVVGTEGGFKQSQIIGGLNRQKMALAKRLAQGNETVEEENYIDKGYFRAMIMTQVKSYLASVIRESGINVLEIDERMMELSEALRDRINIALAEYGLEMPEFYVSRVVTPDDDPNFKRMKEQYAEQYLRVRQEQILQREAEAAADRKAVEARTAAQMKIIEAQGAAEALRIQKAAEADAYRMQAQAEAQEMQMKGYTYQQESSRMIGMEAMKNGIGGEGLGSGLGDIASLGVTLGTMGGIMNMTKETMDSVFDQSNDMGKQLGSAIQVDSWDCTCGTKGITTRFCPNCGSPKPSNQSSSSWNCVCGQTNLISAFCPNCGRPKPDANHWDCPCGEKNIKGNFCPHCGRRKPQ
ncbi:MAG TPA: SPFH domain-containing protein [Candidatus Fimiplasma intestinipullorum]|uniref:SPFH domain-containing protein n=1 Tax=Candidatus Fimiplasma intestinipullorum TaxID=2840825 RepID=A0A9D1L165_9FIRM|nr:SPFH domain-containing protein [Candidatus Fimiplasma intestinipullorum]